MVKSKRKPKTLRNVGAPILRGNTPFVTLKELGELGDGGKAVMKLSGFDRILAKPGIPLTSMAVPIMQQLLPLCRYKDAAEFKEDMATLRLYLKRLVFKVAYNE